MKFVTGTPDLYNADVDCMFAGEGATNEGGGVFDCLIEVRQSPLQRRVTVHGVCMSTHRHRH